MGRPSKGPRDRFSVRPPAAVGQRIREEAKRVGISQGEYIVRLMADHCGLPASNVATVHQFDAKAQELPMTG